MGRIWGQIKGKLGAKRNVGPGIISTACMWIISRKRWPMPNPTLLIPSMAVKEKNPHIREGEKDLFFEHTGDFSPINGIYPQISTSYPHKKERDFLRDTPHDREKPFEILLDKGVKLDYHLC